MRESERNHHRNYLIIGRLTAAITFHWRFSLLQKMTSPASLLSSSFSSVLLVQVKFALVSTTILPSGKWCWNLLLTSATIGRLKDENIGNSPQCTDQLLIKKESRRSCVHVLLAAHSPYLSAEVSREQQNMLPSPQSPGQHTVGTTGIW